MTRSSYTIFGPPGTGKTTYLVEQLRGAVAKHGGERVLVSSFTKTAAVKISSVAVGRAKLEIPNGNIGTLHSLCYRRLGMPPIAEVGELAKEWSRTHAGIPAEAIPEKTKSNIDDPWWDKAESNEKSGDLLSRVNIKRAKLVPVEAWTPQLKEFWGRWQAFKQERGAVDFTDMIERCLAPESQLPDGVKVLFVDEYQDCCPLEVALINRWAQTPSVERVLLSGDDDQMIFGFRGATPDHMLIPLPEDQKRHLKKSYRLPRAIHKFAQNWISRLPRREPKPFEPRDSEGKVTFFDFNYRAGAEGVVDLAEEHARAGRTCMILGSCSYHVDPVVSVMKDRGVPFWNPFRRQNGHWNPMRGLWDRAKAFLAPQRNLRRTGSAALWTWSELDAWLEWIPAEGSGLARGQKALVTRNCENEFLKDIPITESDWTELWKHDSPVRAENPRLLDEAWLKRMAATGAKTRENVQKLNHAFGVVKRFGVETLDKDPLITVGSIHCSPPQERVLTANRGYVPISELVSGMDTLVSWNKLGNQILYGTKNNSNGFEFQKSERPYSGKLISIETEASLTRVTPNHMVRVRFDMRAQEKFVVYLMRRGNWWRVGVTRAPRTNTNASVGVNTRLSREMGDGAWILRLCETRKEACIEEASISAYYGIPGMIFEAWEQKGMKRTFTSNDLHLIHGRASHMVSQRVDLVFKDFGLEKDFPIWTGQNNVKAGKGFLTAAANLLPGLMEAPVVVHRGEKKPRKPIWMPIAVKREDYSGPVYGLHVPPYEYYVSGGAIVHNSVKGEEASTVILFPDLSDAALEEIQQHGMDSIRRVFYVGMTRAREELVICRPFIRRKAVEL